MTAKPSNSGKAEERALVLTRIFDAPREIVWRAWTDPKHCMRWWGPKDFTTPHCSIDLRVGGKYLICMRSPQGKEIWTTGVYLEIVMPERIMFSDSFADEKGNVVPATHYGMGTDLPIELKVTVTFEELNGKTKMTLRHVGVPEGEMEDMMGQGWNQFFDKLAESLARSL